MDHLSVPLGGIKAHVHMLAVGPDPIDPGEIVGDAKLSFDALAEAQVVTPPVVELSAESARTAVAAGQVRHGQSHEPQGTTAAAPGRRRESVRSFRNSDRRSRWLTRRAGAAATRNTDMPLAV